MKRSMTFGRPALLCSALLLALTAALTPANAQTVPTISAGDRLIGQIANLTGSPTSPDSFSLQLGTASVDLRVAPNRVVLRPLSGEAEVEGLTNGDYATVNVRRVKRVWVVVRITFDVQPFAPLRQISGMVQRVSPDGMHVLLRLDQAKTLQLRITRQTRVHVDGRIADSQLLTKGSSVQALLLRTNGIWVAIDLDVHSQYPLSLIRP